MAAADDLAARDARRGAQLGLPLHLDPRLVLHAALAVPARIRLGSARVLRLHHRGAGRRERRLRAADHVRHRRSQGPDRADPRPSVGLAELAAGAGGQRRLGPAPERRVGHAPRRGGHPPAPGRGADRQTDVGGPGQDGRGGHHARGRPRPGHLGDPGRSRALHGLQGPVLGGHGPRRRHGPDPPGPRPGRGVAQGGRRAEGRDPRPGRRLAGPVPPGTTATRSSTPRSC